MANGPIRTLLIGEEAVSGTLAATMQNIYFIPPFTPKDEFARKIIPVHNGTVSGARLRALGTRRTVFSFKTPLFHDQTSRLVSGLFGPPTSAQIGTTGVYTHTFKFGPASTPPTFSIQSYNNVRWRQSLGAVLNTLKISAGKDSEPMLDWEFFGPGATNITAPTIPAIVSAYNPAGFRQFELDVTPPGGALAIADAVSYNLTFDGKRTPFYTGRAAATMRRAKRGLVETKGDVLCDYVAYTGSYKEQFDTEADLGDVLIKYIDPTIIGTSGTNHPQATIEIWNAIMSDAEEPDEGPEAAQHLIFEADYAATPATEASMVFQNTFPTIVGS